MSVGHFGSCLLIAGVELFLREAKHSSRSSLVTGTTNDCHSAITLLLLLLFREIPLLGN